MLNWKFLFLLSFYTKRVKLVKILTRFHEQFSKLLRLFDMIVVRKAKVIHILFVYPALIIRSKWEFRRDIRVVKDRENKKQLMTERQQQKVLALVMP